MENKGHSPEHEAKGLNANHIRVISGTLRLIEKDIDEIEMYIKSAPRGRLYETINDLTDEQEERVLKLIKSLRDCINEFADMLNLKPDTVNLSRIIRGRLSIHWANACDMEPKKLKAYGVFEPDIVETLSFYTQKLINLLHDY